MSDEEELLPTSEAKSEAIDLYDAALDFYSDKFDPLKALMSDKVVVPVPDAPVFDNISKYDSYTKGLKATVAKKQPKVPEPVFQRRFEEHQSKSNISIYFTHYCESKKGNLTTIIMRKCSVQKV